MKAHKWYLIGFAAMILLQWLVPGQMIIRSEKDLENGTKYKFLVSPVDPNDPFRGKYLTLNYRENEIRGESFGMYGKGTTVYVSIREDSNGFAEAFAVSRERPADDGSEYVEATVARVILGDEEAVMTVEYPFRRYYVNEKRAPEIEKVFQEAAGENDMDTYAVIRVRKGRSIIEDLVINGASVQN